MSEERRRLRRREQLLIDCLQHGGQDSGGARRMANFSGKKLEMELLLLELESAGEDLSKALSVESASGKLLGEWQGARRDVDAAEERYRTAVAAYQSFLHALPPPVRASAEERGTRAMERPHLNPAATL
ncbi:MAG TPA: hypothetical protein VMH28_25710 [Candidatus Acidoferrales bacterium]|nr:hypothetical protein [Candidatus Acidoferrales bacterium]